MAEASRQKAKPTDLKKRDWKQAIKRTGKEVKEDNLGLVAAGVAFYAFLSIFPAIAALLAIYGLVADPSTVQQQVQAMSGVVPSQVQSILSTQMQRLAGGSGGALSVGLVVSIILSLWSANKATKNLFEALSIVHDEREERSFIKLNALSLLATTLLVVGMVVLIGLIAVLPAVLGAIGLGSTARMVVQISRWPLAILLVLAALAMLYRLGPDRDQPKWKWVTPGSIVATVLWVLASVGLSIYVSSFASINKTYGSVGAVVVLMLWLLVSAYAVLIGAELNAELERQTPADTTKGRPKPKGRRGAYVADTVAQE